jgi:hypothetical protein
VLLSCTHLQITVLLEDMGLNLQSMLASPFVRPFLSEVRSWEQKLSLIGKNSERQITFSQAHRVHPTDGYKWLV